MLHHKKIFVNPFHTKKVFANMKRVGKDFSGRITPLFDTMMVSASEEVDKDSDHLTDSNQIPIIDQPSTSSQPKQKQKSKRRQRKEAEVLGLEKAKDAQAKEIAALKKRVQRLERKKKSRTTGLKRLKKVDIDADVEWSLDTNEMPVEAKIDEKDEQSTKLDDSTAGEAVTTASVEGSDAPTIIEEITLTQTLIQIKAAKPKVVTTAATTTITTRPKSTKLDDSIAGEAITTASVKGSVAPITIKEITLAQTLIQINAAKPKVVTTVATTTITTRPKVRGVVVQEPSKLRTLQESQPSITKDKGKAIMIEPEVPLKRKDQVALDEQMARDVQAQLEAELIEEEKLARKQQEEANIALIEPWDNTQAMMEADFELAQRLQTKEQGEITIKERSRLFVELMNKRKKHFAILRAEEKKRKPPTKDQKRNQMSTYLKNMGGYKHDQLKSKSCEEIQKMFGNEMRRVNTFIPMDSKVVKSKKEIEERSKGTKDELEYRHFWRSAKLKAFKLSTPKPPLSKEAKTLTHLIQDNFILSSSPPQKNEARNRSRTLIIASGTLKIDI
ncbi:hypothetical protein Tco_0337797 [Tanacetum coccineum]